VPGLRASPNPPTPQPPNPQSPIPNIISDKYINFI